MPAACIFGSGFFAPHSGQNFPLTVAPQEQVQVFAAPPVPAEALPVPAGRPWQRGSAHSCRHAFMAMPIPMNPVIAPPLLDAAAFMESI